MEVLVYILFILTFPPSLSLFAFLFCFALLLCFPSALLYVQVLLAFSIFVCGPLFPLLRILLPVIFTYICEYIIMYIRGCVVCLTSLFFFF
jgi:hypothetical protein